MNKIDEFEKRMSTIETVLGIEAEKPPIVPLFARKAHKTHLYRKICDLCGQSCKGNSGLSIHKSKTHGTKAVKNAHRVPVKVRVTPAFDDRPVI